MADTATIGALKRTPFYDIHRALGAKIVPFAGYEMPVQYPTGITAEHKAVRERCGLFDVSHMGEFIVSGPQAIEFLSYVTTNDVAKLAVGQAHYSTILNDRGTIEDDGLVYRFPDRLMLVVNASNIDKVFAHISRHLTRFDGPGGSAPAPAAHPDRPHRHPLLSLRRGIGRRLSGDHISYGIHR